MTDTPLQATITLRGVLLTPTEETLVLRRASDGDWELPGGRLGPAERPVEGVRREIVEETSLEPTIVEPVHTYAWRNDQDNGRFAVYFRCRCTRDQVSLSPEHTAYRWREFERACNLLSEAQGRAVERAVAGQPAQLDAVAPE